MFYYKFVLKFQKETVLTLKKKNIPWIERLLFELKVPVWSAKASIWKQLFAKCGAVLAEMQNAV